MKKLMTVLVAALFAMSTGAFAQDKKGDMKKDDKKSEMKKDDKKSEMKKDDKKKDKK
jgi:hypothetical protein